MITPDSQGKPASQQEDELKSMTPDRFWFRVHNDVLHDMTYISMSDADLGGYVRLLALANTMRSVGIVYADLSGIARALRMNEVDASGLLERLERAEMIVRDDAMVAILDERHFTGKGLYPSDSRAAQTERQRRSRKKLTLERKAGPSRDGHDILSRHIEENSDRREESQNSRSENRIESNSNTSQAVKKEVPLLGDSYSDDDAGDITSLDSFDGELL